MIGQVTNPKKGVNYYVTPEVEMVELEANNVFLDGGGSSWTGGGNLPGGGADPEE